MEHITPVTLDPGNAQEVFNLMRRRFMARKPGFVSVTATRRSSRRLRFKRSALELRLGRILCNPP
jgi:hypothetical protein